MTNHKRKFDPQNKRLDGIIALVLLMFVLPIVAVTVINIFFGLGR